MRMFQCFVVFVAVLGGVFGSVAAQSPAAGAQIWQSATYHGGSDYEFAETFAVDTWGNAYLLGRTFSGDMHGSVQPASTSASERASATFVLKLTPQGLPEYATTVGTGLWFLPLDLAVAVDGAVHVLARSGDAAHVIKLDAVGGSVEYDVILDGSTEGRYPRAIAVDDAGHAVVAGWSPAGLFVARLDARGSVFDVDVLPLNLDPKDLAIDGFGDAYVVGSITSADLPTSERSMQPRYGGGACADLFPPLRGEPRISPCSDAFLLKVTVGGQIAYATYFGGTGLDEGHRVTVDRTGAAVITGLTRSGDLPTANAVQPQCKPGFAPLTCGDAFIAKIDPTGEALVFATYFGGTDTELVSGLAVDDEGIVYVAGNVTGAGLPVYRAPQPVNAGGRTDGFAAAFGPAGDLRWSTYVGGPDDDRVVGIGAAAGLIQFGGETLSSAWASGGAPFHGARDLFSARLIDSSAR